MPFGMVSGVGRGMGALDGVVTVEGEGAVLAVNFGCPIVTGFVQTLESPGKRHRSWKTLEKSWNSKVVVLEILISGTSIANFRRNSL